MLRTERVSAGPAGITAALPTFPPRLRPSFAELRARLFRILRADGASETTGRNALVAFAVRVISAGLLYLSQIALARWMGGYEYGIYVLAWTWVLVLGGLSPLGLGFAMVRLLPTYRETGESDLARGAVRGARLFALASGTLVALAGLAILHLFEPYIGDHYAWPLAIALACVPLYALGDVQDGIGRAHGWMGTALAPPYIGRPFLVLALMGGIHWWGFAPDAATAALAAVVATWGAALVQMALVNYGLRARQEPGPRRYAFPYWFSISLPLAGITACELLLQNTDVLVISHVLSPREVGIYFAAAKTMNLILFVHFAVGSAVAARFAALRARNDTERLAAVVRQAVNWVFWPSLFGAILLVMLGQPLLLLFGAQFADGYPVMLILVIGLLTRAAVGPAEWLLNMLGAQAWCAGILAGTVVLNLALNFALVPALGLPGAALATSLSMAIAALLNCAVVRFRLGLNVGIWSNLPWRR